MNYFCYQSSEHDCGFAALKMLLAKISRNKNYLYLPKGEKKEHFSFLDLIEIAAAHNVNLGGYELEVIKIREQKLPLLLEFHGNHLVTLLNVKKNIYYINDPSEGRIKLTEEELRKRYSGHALIVDNENIDRKFKVQKPQLMPKSFALVHVVIAALIIAMLGLDFYLMNLSENVPFIFMLIMFLILIEVFENWYLLKMSDYFDERYIPIFFRKAENQNYDDYKNYLGVKVHLFESSKSMVVFASLAIILGVLISINDPRNLLVIAIIIVYKAIEKYVTQKSDEKLVKEMSKEEACVFNGESQTIPMLVNLNKKSNQYGMSLTTRNCFFQLILMLLTLFMMILSKTMSANYAVFHFGIYFVIGQGISMLFNRLTDNQEHVKKLTKFYDKCGL